MRLALQRTVGKHGICLCLDWVCVCVCVSCGKGNQMLSAQKDGAQIGVALQCTQQRNQRVPKQIEIKKSEYIRTYVTKTDNIIKYVIYFDPHQK